MKRILSSLILLSAVAWSADVPKGIDLCELFREPSRWNGVMVSVRGTLHPPDSENETKLAGESCEGHIEVKGTVFRNLIELEDPQSSFRLHSVGFEWDPDSLREMNSLLARIDRRRQEVVATVVGVFETRDPLADLIQEHRPYPFNGFGHLNGSPAQILVKTMVNFKIQPRSR